MFTHFAYNPTPAMAQEIIGIDEQFPEFHNRVRFDADTRKGSVLDVIQVMTGQERKNLNRVLTSIGETHPELVQRFEKIRIGGMVSTLF